MGTRREEPVRIGVCGAAGRMGRRIIACVTDDEGCCVSGAVDVDASGSIGRDSGELSGCGANGVAVTTDLAAVCAASDVVIDFALHEGFGKRLEEYVRALTPCVIGTTAVGSAGEDDVRAASEKISIVHAPNFSVGVNVLCALVRQAAEALGAGYDIELIEMHHRRKKDAPSGTATRLLEVLEGATGVSEKDRVYGREGMTGARRAEEIGVHAVRGGGVVGDHTVVFASESERVELTHRAETRDVFARGAIRAAVYVRGRTAGLYTMTDVLGLSE